MDWIDIASVVFVCVTMNHLGLIGKLEEIYGKLPIINCPKCSTFWSVLVCGMVKASHSLFTLQSVFTLLAISFLASYMALWLELLEGFIDSLYMKLYDTIYKNPTDTSAADTDGGHSDGSVS